MKQHTKIYMKALGYDECDFMPSELSGATGIDIHHIIGRGKGGEDRIENLMLLTRQEHIDYGEVKSKMHYLLNSHRLFLIHREVEFDNEWFNKWLQYYEDTN